MPDVGYPRDPSLVRLLPGVVEALRALKAAGFLLVLVSNQSGVSRGFIAPAEAAAMHDRLERELSSHGVALDGAYYCPHAPEDRCGCRKPAPGLLYRAARELDVDLAASYVVGDRPSDIAAGRLAGCRTILVGRTARVAEADAVAAGWDDVVTIVAEKGAR